MQQKQKEVSNFKVFVDQPTDEKDIEEQWQRTRQLNRRTQLKRVLIAGAISIGLLFAAMLSVFGHHPAPVVLDNTHPDYTLIQSSMLHLKVVVSKKADTYQAKMMRGVGIAFPELLAWLEGNLHSKLKVLLVPDESSGTALLAMVVGYYLESAPFDVLITDQQYLQLVKFNQQLMKEHHPTRMNLNFLGDESRQNKYDLVVLENRGYEGDSDVVGVVQVQSSMAQGGEGYRYLISKGKIDDFISKVGKWYGYSVAPAASSEQNEKGWTAYLSQQRPNPAINLCPEQVPAFAKDSHLRSLVEFFRNKTVGTVYYGLESQRAAEVIQKFGGIGRVEMWKQGLSEIEEGSWTVLTGKMALENSLKVGTLVVEVSSESEAAGVKEKFRNEALVLPGTNSNGCYYPPKLFPYPSATSYPSFLIVSLPNESTL